MDYELNEHDEWDTPQEFEGVSLPEWPIEAFPESARKFLKEVARSTETPIEMASLLFLSAIATAVQKKYEVEIHSSYREPLAIWTLSILPSGSRKSKVFEFIMLPIISWEEEKRANHCSQTGSSTSKKATLEEKVKFLRRRAAAASSEDAFDESQRQIERIEQEIELIQTQPRLWTSDITPEHLSTLMLQNGGSMSILSDEGAIFDILGGLYSRGKSNMDLFLKGYSGGAASIDRSKKAAVYIKKALLTIGITCQPEIIKTICKNKTFRGRGLLARFIFAYPASNIGHRTNEEGPIDEAINTHYHSVMKHILNLQDSRRHILKLEPAAYSKWLEYSKVVEMMMSPELDHLTHINDWASKLNGQIIRIAALLHIYRNASTPFLEQPISFEDVQGAVKIGHVLIQHALKVFRSIYEDEKTSIAKEILQWIKGSTLTIFTQRDCSRRFRRYDVKTLKEGLDILKQEGILFESKIQRPKGAPSLRFEVNPLCIKTLKGQ